MSAKASKKDLAKPYEPTAAERGILERHLDRLNEKPPAPRMKVSLKGEAVEILPDHPDFADGHILLMEALGTTDLDFLGGLLGQLANAGAQGRNVDGQAVPGTRREGLDRLPLPWRRRRSPEGRTQWQVSARALCEGDGGGTPSPPRATPAIPEGTRDPAM